MEGIFLVAGSAVAAGVIAISIIVIGRKRRSSVNPKNDPLTK